MSEDSPREPARATGTGPLWPREQQRQRTAAEREEAARARRVTERRRAQRRRSGVTAAVVVVALVLAGGVALLVRGGSGTPASSGSSAARQIVPTTPTGTTTVEKAVRQVADHSGIPGVMAWDTGDWPGAGTSTAAGILEHQHVTGPVTYSVTPPVGGPHDVVWMNAGVYTEPVPDERAVHDLEHGAVWVTYRPDLPAAQVTALRAFVGRQSLIDESAGSQIAGQESRYVDLSPWASDLLPSPVVISAWGHQLRVATASDPRLQRFVDVFRHTRQYTPEYGAAVDGQRVQTSGRAAADGATKPNPSGRGQ